MKVDVDPYELLTNPHHIMQTVSIQLIKERETLRNSILGMPFKNSSITGKVVDITPNYFVIEATDKTKKSIGKDLQVNHRPSTHQH